MGLGALSTEYYYYKLFYTVRHCTLMADAATGVDLCSRKQMHNIASFLPSVLLVFTEYYKSLIVCECVRTSVEDHNFERAGVGCMYVMTFI